MSSSLLLLVAMLSAGSILLRTNDHLQGAKTPQIVFYLRMFVFGCFLAPIVMRQWQNALVLPIVWLILIHPLSRQIGARIGVMIWRNSTTGPFEQWVGLPSRRNVRIARQLEQVEAQGDANIHELMRLSKQRDALRDMLMDGALGQPQIQSIVRTFGATRESIDGFMHEIIAAGGGGMVMGHRLPEAIANYPRPLTVALAWKAGRVKANQSEMATRMFQYFQCGRRLPEVEPLSEKHS